MVTRGEGPLGVDLSEARVPSVLMFALPLRTLPAQLYEQGIAVGLVHMARATDGTSAAGAKTSNYLGSVLALHEVKQRGSHEAIIVGPLGEVVEGATSNVFVVRDGELRTPPIEAGILAGITRKVVLELAARLRLAMHEKPAAPCRSVPRRRSVHHEQRARDRAGRARGRRGGGCGPTRTNHANAFVLAYLAETQRCRG